MFDSYFLPSKKVHNYNTRLYSRGWLPYKKGRDARREISIEPLKKYQSWCGLSWVLPQKGTDRGQAISFNEFNTVATKLAFHLSFLAGRVELVPASLIDRDVAPLKGIILYANVVFCFEHPKRYQNPRF